MKSVFNYKLFLLLISVLVWSSARSQVERPGMPLYNVVEDTLYIPILEIEAPEVIKPKNSTESAFKVDQFAVPVDVDISPSEYGVWVDYTEFNKRVWLLRVKSSGAQSINLWFDKFKLMPGAKLFLYNASQSSVYGAYTHLNNKEWNAFAIKPMYTDELFIELQVPIFANEYGEFNLGQVGVEKDDRLQLKSVSDQYYGRSATCHVDVNCLAGGNYHRQKKSVCRIIYRGGRRCTGTLVNNLDNDGTPYVITAGHCISSDFVAQTAVFDFGYESPTCEGADIEIPETHSISGANLVSTAFNDSKLDFVLLKLSEKLKIEAEPYYSGWDATGTTPMNSYMLHHPEGDVKKISVDEDEALESNYTPFDPNSFWAVVNYEVGTSENGSSGAGLISHDNLLTGTLTGGGDTCTENIYDFYQKFSRSYNDYADSSMQLKYWLDPNNTNVLVCKPMDVTLEFRERAEVVTNIKDNDAPKLVRQGEGWGYLSGHNYQGNALFAEHLKVNGSKYIYGANIDIGESFASDFNQSVVFTVWSGGNQPGDVIYEYEVPTTDLDVTPYKIDFDSTILLHKEFYFGYRIQYNADTFALKTVSTSEAQNSAYTFIDNSWVPLQLDGNSYHSKLSLEVLAFDYLPLKGVTPDSVNTQNVHIYPNPSKNSFQAFFKEGVRGQATFKIYNIQGKLMYRKEVTESGANVQINHNLKAGIYILNIMYGDSRYQSNKLIVL